MIIHFTPWSFEYADPFLKDCALIMPIYIRVNILLIDIRVSELTEPLGDLCPVFGSGRLLQGDQQLLALDAPIVAGDAPVAAEDAP